MRDDPYVVRMVQGRAGSFLPGQVEQRNGWFCMGSLKLRISLNANGDGLV